MHAPMRGVTFIEVVIVLALMAIVARGALLFSFDSYRGSSFRSARDGLISALEHARAQATNDVCVQEACTESARHGVAFQHGRYVIFEGDSYALRDTAADQYIDTNASVTYRGFSEVVFATSSGQVSSPSSVTLSDAAGHHSTITVGTEGQISWTQ